MQRPAIILLATLLLTACAGGERTYKQPGTAIAAPYSVLVDRPLDEVWRRTVPRIGAQFFVINNLDKESGLMNVSYSGDPTRYVDCGHIRSSITNIHGTQPFDANPAAPASAYQFMSGIHWVFVQRRTSLEGRINLIFQPVTPASTRVTANARYVMTHDVEAHRHTDTIPTRNHHVLTFDSSSEAQIDTGFEKGLSCRPTGQLERSLLELTQ